MEKYKLDFNFTLVDIEKEPIQTLKPGVKAGQELTPDLFMNLKANKLLGNTLANSNDDFNSKEFYWFDTLYNKGIIELDKVDANSLKSFITESRKKGKQNFTNIVVMQLYSVFEKAGLK